MRKIAATVSASIAGAIAALLLLGYSPAACGCADPFNVLLFHSGVNPITAKTDLSAAGIEPRLNRVLQGTAVRFGEFPYTREHGCRQEGPDQIVCVVPVAKSRVLTRGMVVVYETHDAKFQHARVRHSYWP